MRLPGILIVEDDPLIRKLLVQRFLQEPLEVDTATDGVEALRQLASGRYAVLLMDLMMVRMSGFEVIEALRRYERRPMVFVLTAYDDVRTRELDGRIVHAVWRKPFDLERLVETIRECAVRLEAGAPRTWDAAAFPREVRP